ncbi:GNAT family N-acetyltransferase [Mucilaginibacter sp. PAMB04274]|uniref:GNAT family N-acetyltransferase n=1 Tax=Mucilaginibacter sp. PAMB04274 TaxID=3138568 RepID=UPI0031F61489
MNNQQKNQVELKHIDVTDVNAVVGLFDKYRVFYKQQSDVVEAHTFLNERLCNNESVIVIAECRLDDNVVVKGFTQLYPKFSSARMKRNWILNDLFVDEPYRNQGIGKMIIEYALKFAKQNNAKYVQLETSVDNYAAQRLYESIGFIKLGIIDGFIIYKKEVN